MSGTEARALGPFGAIVFGLPVALGFGIDAIHGFTSVFLVLAAALVFWELCRLNPTMAWAWLIVFTAMRMVWWNAAMFWVCTLLLPLGLLQLALFIAILRTPTSLKLTSMTLVLVLALHVHLVALVGLPILVLAFMVASRHGIRDTESAPRGVAQVVVALLLVASVVPLRGCGRTDEFPEHPGDGHARRYGGPLRQPRWPIGGARDARCWRRTLRGSRLALRR